MTESTTSNKKPGAIQTAAGIIAVAGLFILLGKGWVRILRASRERSGNYGPRPGDWVFGTFMAIVTGIALIVTFGLLVYWIQGAGVLVGIVLWVFGFWFLHKLPEMFRATPMKTPSVIKEASGMQPATFTQENALEKTKAEFCYPQAPVRPPDGPQVEERKPAPDTDPEVEARVQIIDHHEELVSGSILNMTGRAIKGGQQYNWSFECPNLQDTITNCYWTVTTPAGGLTNTELHIDIWLTFATTTLQDYVFKELESNNVAYDYIAALAVMVADNPGRFLPRMKHVSVDKQEVQPMTDESPEEITIPVKLSVTIASDETPSDTEPVQREAEQVEHKTDSCEPPTEASSADEVKACYSKIAPWVKELFGDMAEFTHEDHIQANFGSTMLWISIVPFSMQDTKNAKKNETLVMIRAYLVFGAEPKPEMLLYLLQESSHMPYGGFGIDDDGRVFFQISVVGSSCTEYELKIALIYAAQMGDKYDDEIKVKFGGARFRDFIPLPKS